jgi:hypothetical protein
MRRYGMTVQEIVLGDLLALKGVGLVLLAIAAAVWPGALLPDDVAAGGLLAGATGAAGVLLILAGGGLRQNRAALDLGQGILALVALGWLVWGIVAGRAVPICIGAALLALFALVTLVRRAAIRARFQPRFFSTRQFETLVAVVDTMIDGDGRQVQSPEEVAVTVDHLMDEIRTPVTAELKTVLVLVEWALPVLIGRPLPFSTLGSHQRRRVVEKVIGAKGLFRDVARSLKVLASAGYYGSPEGMRAMGYRPFDERERGRRADQTPLHHPDPFPAGDREAVRR